MPRYSLIKNNAVVETRVYESQPEDVPHKGITWLPFVEEYPAFDSSTEKLNAASTKIEAERVYRTATVHTITAEEVAAALEMKKDENIAEAERGAALFDIAFNQENRIRSIEGKGAVTKEQFKTAIRSLLS